MCPEWDALVDLNQRKGKSDCATPFVVFATVEIQEDAWCIGRISNSVEQEAHSRHGTDVADAKPGRRASVMLKRSRFTPAAANVCVNRRDSRRGLATLSESDPSTIMKNAAILVVERNTSERASLVQRFLIVLSAIPIAVFANVLRITLTGVLHETVGSKAANFVFHDVAGWLMIPLALALLALELWFLGRLFITQTRQAPGEPLPNGPLRPAMAERSGRPEPVHLVQTDSRKRHRR